MKEHKFESSIETHGPLVNSRHLEICTYLFYNQCKLYLEMMKIFCYLNCLHFLEGDECDINIFYHTNQEYALRCEICCQDMYEVFIIRVHIVMIYCRSTCKRLWCMNSKCVY